MKKYYKVVYGSNLASAVRCGPNEVQYKIGKFVYAPVQGTYLFVFDNKESALKFKQGSEVHHVYECEVEGLCDNPINHSDEIWPRGTKFAYGVKLTKLVEITDEVILNKKLENLDIVKCCNEKQYVQLDGDYVVIKNSNGYNKDRKLHKNIVWSDATHFKFSDGIAQYEWIGRKAKLVMELEDDN